MQPTNDETKPDGFEGKDAQPSQSGTAVSETMEPLASTAAAPDASPAWIHRFDLHQRIQHLGVASSFIGLVLTGWPMRASESAFSQSLVDFMGGASTVGWWHRFFGSVLIAASLYHLAYVAWLASRGRLRLDMLPSPRDFRDVFQNVLFLTGLSRTRPRFGRYTYWEKFDYWAVFWGMVIIGGSGLVLWFPVSAASFLPPWAVRLSQLVHGDEALLALMAIFIWHFYNGHFRPTTFPVNRVFLTGKLPAALVREEYADWWDELERARKGGRLPARTGAREEGAPRGPHVRALLFTGGLTGVLLLAIAAWAWLGFGLRHVPHHSPIGTRGPGWEEHLATAGKPAAGAAAAVSESHRDHPHHLLRGGVSAPAYLQELAGLPLESVESAVKLECFKSCHSSERFPDGSFPHATHAGKGLDCADCHSYAAHQRSEISDEACEACH